MTRQAHNRLSLWQRVVSWIVPDDVERRQGLWLHLLRVLIATNLLLGTYYLTWRYAASINWATWPFALALILAETYSYFDGWLFGLTMWRLKQRGEPPPPPPDATVDVFITCYNEPVELVRETARAAQSVTFPHMTYILDDGNSPEMEAMAQDIGVGYIRRSEAWQQRDPWGRAYQRHAKAGNLNNALDQTDGEFLMILDADQIPEPSILDRTLGYFRDDEVALVQTPQWFSNVPPGDPFGSQAPLFYGPIQQGKDGWNAAFFCGSNAVLRREALIQLGLSRYVLEKRTRLETALKHADRLLRHARHQIEHLESDETRAIMRRLHEAIHEARRAWKSGETVQEVTAALTHRLEAAARTLITSDMERIRAELAEIDLVLDEETSDVMHKETDPLVLFEHSPLAAITEVREAMHEIASILRQSQDAMDVMPMATISVTEDMATAMRLHARGWRSVYHDEILAKGLAPEDLRSSLQQRLRWAQGTIQVMLKENPLLVRGLAPGQRLMYFATMWSYLSGFASVVYLIAPVLYLVFGLLPVKAFNAEFFWHLLPYLLVNQTLFLIIGWGKKTWRGQQYSLALFPLWIKAVTTTLQNVYLGKKLGFVVTPKVRQGGIFLGLVRIQLIMMALLVVAVIIGLGRLAFGLTDEGFPIVINVFWACYDLVMLSVVLDAATYQPDEPDEPEADESGVATVAGAIS